MFGSAEKKEDINNAKDAQNNNQPGQTEVKSDINPFDVKRDEDNQDEDNQDEDRQDGANQRQDEDQAIKGEEELLQVDDLLESQIDQLSQ